jgi:hypothetical protein
VGGTRTVPVVEGCSRAGSRVLIDEEDSAPDHRNFDGNVFTACRRRTFLPQRTHSSTGLFSPFVNSLSVASDGNH